MSDVGLSSELELSITAALAMVDELTTAITAATTDVPVTFDVSSVQDSIAAAVGDVQVSPQVDPAPITAGIDAAVADSQLTLPFDPDVSSITPAIDEAVNAADTSIELQIDTGGAQDALEGVAASSADASTGLADVGKSSHEASAGSHDAALSLGLFEAAAHGAEGSASQLTGAFGGLGSEAGHAIGAIGAATLAVGGLFKVAVDAAGAAKRLDDTFGPLSEDIKTIGVGNLNEDLSQLATSLGTTGAEIEDSAATLQQFGTNAGFTAGEAEKVTEQFIALAARAVALNPSLGSVADVADTMATRLARGGRFAQSLGISLTSAEINARALGDTGKTTAADLTVYEKAAAAAALATEKYGDTLRETIERGTANPIIQLRALKAQFEENIETIGQPLIAPVFTLLEDSLPVATKLAQGFADGVGPLIPLVDLLAKGIGLIPGPVVTAGIAFVLLRTILAAVSTGLLTMATSASAGAAATTVLGAAATGLSAALGPIALLTAAVFAYKAMMDKARQVGKEFGDEVRANLPTDNIDDMKAAVGRLDSGIADLSNTIDGSSAPWDADFRASLKQGRTELENIRSELTKQIVTVQALSSKYHTSTDDVLAFAKANGIDLTGSLEDVTAAYDDAISSAGVNSASVLANIQQAEGYARTLGDLVDQAPAVIASADAVAESHGRNAAAFQFLAAAADQAGLSQDQLAAIAARLGVAAEDLGPMLEAITAETNAFADAIIAKLPSIDDAVSSLGTNVDPTAFITALKDQEDNVNGFVLRIQALMDEGNVALAQTLADQGPAIGGALAKAFLDAGPDTAAAANAQVVSTQTALDNAKTAADTWAPTFESVLGTAATNATTAFGENIDLSTQVSDATTLAADAALRGGDSVAAALAAGVAAGIEARAAQIRAAAHNAAYFAVSEMNKVFGISSPSRAGLAAGSNVAAAVAAGIADSADKAAIEAGKMAAAVVAAAAISSPDAPMASVAGAAGQVAGSATQPTMVIENITIDLSGTPTDQVAEKAKIATDTVLDTVAARGFHVELKAMG